MSSDLIMELVRVAAAAADLIRQLEQERDDWKRWCLEADTQLTTMCGAERVAGVEVDDEQ